MYRSGHNENDSKSFGRQKRPVGSNPTVSAMMKLEPIHSAFYVIIMMECLLKKQERICRKR